MSRDSVVEAAVAVMDRTGIDTVSIRSVAAELGVHPSSLYTYVDSRADLLLDMARHVFGETLHAPLPLPATREDIIRYLVQVNTATARHPELLRLLYSATDVFEYGFPAAEAIFRYLLSRGLDVHEARDTYTILFTFTLGAGYVVGSVGVDDLVREQDQLAAKLMRPEHREYEALRAALGGGFSRTPFPVLVGTLLDQLAPPSRRRRRR